jgi:hypothetical protein
MSIFNELSVFNRVTFVEKTHTYLIDDEITNSLSVTGVIKKFKPTFDVDLAASRVAKKRNVLVGTIKAEWEINNLLATTTGSIVHKYIENYYSNKKIPIDQTLISSVLGNEEKQKLLQNLPTLISHFQSFYKDYSDLLCARTELVVGDLDDTKICGMVDLLCYNKRTDSFEILDFKTNKKINTEALYNTQLKDPFRDMPDCEHTHYTIQLNTYKYIIEKYTNIKITGLKIVWLNVNNPTYIVFNIPDIQSRIKEVFRTISLESKIMQ